MSYSFWRPQPWRPGALAPPDPPSYATDYDDDDDYMKTATRAFCSMGASPRSLPCHCYNKNYIRLLENEDVHHTIARPQIQILNISLLKLNRVKKTVKTYMYSQKYLSRSCPTEG